MNLNEAHRIYREANGGHVSNLPMLIQALGWALNQLPQPIWYYACYGYINDPDADLDNPANRSPYVHGRNGLARLNTDGSLMLPDTWPDSGPFDTYAEAWQRALEIEKREFRTSW